jgi:hypothetical protein
LGLCCTESFFQTLLSFFWPFSGFLALVFMAAFYDPVSCCCCSSTLYVPLFCMIKTDEEMHILGCPPADGCVCYFFGCVGTERKMNGSRTSELHGRISDLRTVKR